MYFFAIYLPQSRLEQTIGKAGQAVRNTLDPGRALRDAQQEFDLAPTAHNQTKLANALLEGGMVKEAVERFDACLRGPFAGDAEIVFAAARARLAYSQPQAAIGMLDGLRTKQPGFRPEQVSLALAKAYAAAAAMLATEISVDLNMALIFTPAVSAVSAPPYQKCTPLSL